MYLGGAPVLKSDFLGGGASVPFAAWCVRVFVFLTLFLLSALCHFQTQYGCTAMIAAAHAGHTECVRLLLDAGADKNAKACVRGLRH